MHGKVVIGTKLDTKEFDKQIEDVEHELEIIDELLSNPKELSGDDLRKYNTEAEKLRNKLVDLKKKQEELDNPPSEVLSWSDNFGKSIEKNIRKVSRLILGIFGIRTAYNLVRNAMNTITSEDEQLKADIDYMKNVITYMLEPVVRRIVELMKTLMFYVGYIAKAWFGVNIYAKASDKALKSGAKSAKEMTKSLQKFDEANVLSGSSGGDSGGATTSFDLSEFDDMPVPKWLEWIKDHKEEIISGLIGIAGALTLIKLGLDPLMASGIGVTIAGVVYLVSNLLGYLKDPTWEKFGKIITGLGIAVTGLGIAFFGLPAIIAGVAVVILGIVITYWEQIKSKLTEGIEWLESKSDWVREHLGNVVGDIYDNIIDTLKLIIIDMDIKFTSMKNMFDGLIEFITGVFSKDWEKAWNGVSKILENWGIGLKSFVITIIGIISSMVTNTLRNISATISDFIGSPFGLNLKSIMGKGFAKGGIIVPLARGGIINKPGSGIPLGQARGGEAGAEGVIPLTDSQQMALLGEAIGRYITVNATVVNSMNGRILSKELQKIQAEEDFAFNN